MSYEHFELPDYPCKRDLWDDLKEEKRPIVVYGMGNGADKLIRRLEAMGGRIADFFASDGFVRGHSFHGKRVKSFSEIREEYDEFVILLSFATGRDEVLFLLREMDMRYDLLIPDMPVAGEDEYFDKDFYNSNYESIVKAYESLCDEKSKNCFAAVVNYKLYGRMKYLTEAFSEKEDIYRVLPLEDIEVMIDAGAYNGDTAREAKKYFPNLKKVVAIEADKRNFKKLSKYSEAEADIKIESINAAVWSECGAGSFSSSGNRNSSVNSTSSFEHKEEETSLISVDSLSEKPDYIKYDVEGAEYEALVGSLETIKSSRPCMLVSLYHRSRDIFALVNLLSENLDCYNLYLRRLMCVPAWDLDLLAVPREKEKFGVKE